MKKRILLISLALATLLSGCGEKKVENTGSDAEFLKYLETAEYPIETDKKISIWSWTGGGAVGDHADANQFPGVLDYEKKTGVDVEYIFPTGNQKEAFNLLIASNDLPDLINWWWSVPTDFPGGAEKAISDGYIAAFNEMMPKYMPNMQKFLEENKRLDRDIKTDAGLYYYAPSYMISEADKSSPTCGFIFRKDWLDELGLPVPETWEDWYTTLKAFKEEKGAELPFSVTYAILKVRGITNAYKFALGLYVDGKEVKYGFAEPQYKEFIEEMNKWYNEGLIDPNIASIDQKSVDSKIISGRTGATFGWLSNMLTWTKAAKETEPDFELIGVPFPVMEKGDPQNFGWRDAPVYQAGCAISATSPNKELAAKLLDYGYSEEGAELLNVGRENETFVFEDGKYKMTDLISNNPEGWSYTNASTYYIGGIAAPKINILNDNNYVQFYNLPEQYAAKDVWKGNDPSDTRLPNALTPAADKAARYAKLLTDMEAYADEMFLKFLTGVEPISDFDAYIDELKKSGLDELLQITQESYDRYLAR